MFDRVDSPDSAWVTHTDEVDETDSNGIITTRYESYIEKDAQPLADQFLAGVLPNQDDRKTRIDQFKADVVLTMDLTGLGGNVDSRVWDLRTKEFVWSAISDVYGRSFADRRFADAFTNDLMRRLRDDGMVPACADPSTSASQAAGAATEHNDGSAPNGTAPSH